MGRGPLPPPSDSHPQPLEGGWEGSLRGGRGSHRSPGPPLKAFRRHLGRFRRPGVTVLFYFATLLISCAIIPNLPGVVNCKSAFEREQRGVAVLIPGNNFRHALILGGARSGKSSYALELARQFSSPRLYLATAEAGDEEMAARIAQHRQDRGEGWDTWEAPLNLAEAIAQAQGRYQVILADCLTLWLSNRLIRGGDQAGLKAVCVELVSALKQAATPTILVSNEVGWGIVPENPLAREFRDWAGWLHQLLAAESDLVVLLVAGLPLTLKSAHGKGE
jgi:adenosylcobinamide kinase/adenosylcobinamide-phosphate guanylyltransferase